MTLQNQLKTLLNSKPETGEQWAEICRIESLIEQEKACRAGGFCRGCAWCLPARD